MLRNPQGSVSIGEKIDRKKKVYKRKDCVCEGVGRIGVCGRGRCGCVCERERCIYTYIYINHIYK